MTPRALQTEHGLPGPGQDIWSADMKATIRSMVFIEDYVQVLRTGGEDAGGSVDANYQPMGNPLDGRIDMIGNNTGVTAIFGEQIAEATTHVVSLNPGVNVTSKDRVEIEDKVYIVTSEATRTEQGTTHLQVKELHG